MITPNYMFFRLHRFTLLCSLLILLATSYFILHSFESNPPTYKRLKEWESDLPQHNLDLPFPEGRTGRYVLFKNQVQKLGWNNVLIEV
jgi:hypothetical protein